MFSHKEKVEITAGEPQFTVRYVGKTETYTATGVGCTAGPVQRIWDNSADEHRMRKCLLLVNPSGILLQDAADPASPGVKFDIRDISYCSGELSQHERVFSWVWQEPETRRLECHAVVCATSDKARAVAVLMSRAFQVAYKDWKGDKERQARQRRRHRSPMKVLRVGDGFEDTGGNLTGSGGLGSSGKHAPGNGIGRQGEVKVSNI